jgi:hypothetical protein
MNYLLKTISKQDGEFYLEILVELLDECGETFDNRVEPDDYLENN